MSNIYEEYEQQPLSIDKIDALKGYAGLQDISAGSVWLVKQAITDRAEKSENGKAWLELVNSTDRLDQLIAIQITRDYLDSEFEKYGDEDSQDLMAKRYLLSDGENAIQISPENNRLNSSYIPRPKSWDESWMNDIDWNYAYQDSIQVLSNTMNDDDFKEIVGCSIDDWNNTVSPTLDNIPDESKWSYCRNLDLIISANLESEAEIEEDFDFAGALQDAAHQAEAVKAQEQGRDR